MNILILGVTGMFGHRLYDYLSSDVNLNIHGYSRNESPRTDIHGDMFSINWRQYLIEKNIHSVVNCVGILNNQTDLDLSSYLIINSTLPIFLAKICDEINAQFIHISTDCVYDGKSGPYDINDTPNAKDNYGFSKTLGESCLFYKSTCVLRTSIIGLEKSREKNTGLVHWLLNQNDPTVFGYTEVFWNGITTNELSRITKISIYNNHRGLIIPTCEEPISKYELLKLLVDKFELPIEVKPSPFPKSNKVMLPSTHFKVKPLKEQINEL